MTQPNDAPSPENTINLSGKTILYLVTEDWYFWSHRLPFARAARDAGAKIIVACRFAEHLEQIEAEGFHTAPIPFDRSGMNPMRDMQTLKATLALYRQVRPDLVHHVAMKPVLYGGIAAWRAKVPAVVNAMAGLGFLFIGKSLKARLVRRLVERAFRWLNNRANTRLIVQNDDDAALFQTEIGVSPSQISIIRGSGVDPNRFAPTPEPIIPGPITPGPITPGPITPGSITPGPRGPIIAVCVSRMLWDKGIGELVEAARLLKERQVPLRIRLVGPTDANPASIPQKTLDQWQAEGLVEVCGPSSDVPGIYANAHIAVLPSYREGLPKSLLEGAACGRPIVATDVPGCREICRDGETGLLVPLQQVKPLADALQQLCEDAPLRQKLGQGARHVIETELSEKIIVGQTLALYGCLITSFPQK